MAQDTEDTILINDQLSDTVASYATVHLTTQRAVIETALIEYFTNRKFPLVEPSKVKVEVEPQPGEVLFTARGGYITVTGPKASE